MKKDQRRYLVLGLVLGILLTMSLSPISAATHTITAFLRPDFQFFFDGEAAPLPEGQAVLVYEGRSYVPARFVAESMGGTVLWDEVGKNIFVTLPEPVIIEPEVPEEEEPEEEEEPAASQPSGNYRRLPVTSRTRDLTVTADLFTLSDAGALTTGGIRYFTARLYLLVENDSDYPIELRQVESRFIVDGVEYLTSDISAAYYDTEWYQHIQADSDKEGYIVLPDIPEDSKEMKVYLKFVTYDYLQTEREVVLDIRLELE